MNTESDDVLYGFSRIPRTSGLSDRNKYLLSDDFYDFLLWRAGAGKRKLSLNPFLEHDYPDDELDPYEYFTGVSSLNVRDDLVPDEPSPIDIHDFLGEDAYTVERTIKTKYLKRNKTIKEVKDPFIAEDPFWDETKSPSKKTHPSTLMLNRIKKWLERSDDPEAKEVLETFKDDEVMETKLGVNDVSGFERRDPISKHDGYVWLGSYTAPLEDDEDLKFTELVDDESPLTYTEMIGFL